MDEARRGARGNRPGARPGLPHVGPAAPWLGVDPVAGTVATSVPGVGGHGPAAVYVVRDGIALGLTGGANGQAWGYDLAAGRVTWNSPALPWPHFFADLSGLGGSAAISGGAVVVTACPHLAASPGICADPELVAFSL